MHTLGGTLKRLIQKQKYLEQATLDPPTPAHLRSVGTRF